MPSIATVTGKKMLKQFVKLPFALYQNNPHWVPPLNMDEMQHLDPKRNPMFETSEAKLFLAYRGGRAVGRVAAILSHAANQKHHSKNMRFGWFESEKDFSTASGLMQAVEEWARAKGAETITGPQGFSDFDHQGMLIRGFDQKATIAGSFNHPYYPRYLERMGFVKEVDYYEYLCTLGDFRPTLKRWVKLGKNVLRRSGGGLKVIVPPSKKYLKQRSGELRRVLNESYQPIYGAVPFSQKQWDYYLEKYLALIWTRYAILAANRKDEIVGFIFGAPNMSRAFQKAGGRLLPTGLFHILRDRKKLGHIDMYLIGVRRKYQGGGAAGALMGRFFEHTLEDHSHDSSCLESNPVLETNRLSRAFFEAAPHKLHKTRRIYKKTVR